MSRKARAIMHGAVSVVNAIATGKGSALGISLKVIAEVSFNEGHGLRFVSGSNNDELVNSIINRTVPTEIIRANLITIKVFSEIPIGYGLKSSSAVSNAIALACKKLVKQDDIDDDEILEVAVHSSLESKVSFTGAFDDATACYFGGLTITDNHSLRLIHKEKAPEDLTAIIFLPRSRKRGDVRKLSNLSDLFMEAFKHAEAGQYWSAMKLNGVLTSVALSSSYEPVMTALENGAISAGVSGNGPSVAAIAYDDNIKEICQSLSKFDGRIIVSKVNNQKARVMSLDG